MATAFISYSHRDEVLREELEKHLAALKRQGLLSVWHDRMIIPGSLIDDTIDARLDSADVILLLISSDFVHSEYCYNKEMQRAMERHHSNSARVIPIMIRPCDVGGLPFANLLMLPRDARPVTIWPNKDEAWRDVSVGIRKTLELVRREPANGPDRHQSVSSSGDSPDFLLRAKITTGREAEIAKIRQIIEAARNRRSGAFILLGGKSGSGKTHLAHEACRYAFTLGYDVVSTACEPFHEGMSLFPVKEILRKISGSNSLASAVEQYYGSQCSQSSLARIAEDAEADPPQRRDAYLATFANALYGRFSGSPGRSGRPILLFIDDLEWIEAATSDALLCLRARFPEGPVVVLGAYRTDMVAGSQSAQHALRPLINLSIRHPDQMLHVDLAGLPRERIGSLCDAVLGSPCAFPPRFYDRLYRETEGNPLFMRELLKTLVSHSEDNNAAIQKFGDEWRLVRDIEQWAIPPTIEEAILSRLHSLNEVHRKELEKAAVVGRHFAYSIMLELAATSEDDLLDCLESLVNRDVIQEHDQQDLVFEFTHGKIRDVIYSSIPKFRRLRLHSNVAAVLKILRERGARQDLDGLLGNHLYLATQYTDACGFLLSSARASSTLFAISLAMEQYERALDSGVRTQFPDGENEWAIKIEYADVLRRAGSYERALNILSNVIEYVLPIKIKGEVLDSLGDLYWLKGDSGAALEKYEQCERLAREIKDPDLLLEVLADLCELHDREAERLAGVDPDAAIGHRELSNQLLDEEIRLASDSTDVSARSRAYRNAAKRHRREGRIPEALEAYRTALEGTNPSITDHKILVSYAKTLRFAGDSGQAQRLIQRVLDWGVQTGARRTEAIARQYTGILLLEDDDSQARVRAGVELKASLALHEEIAYSRGIREASLLLGVWHAGQGDWSQAAKMFSAATQVTSDDIGTVVSAAIVQLRALDEHTIAGRLISLSKGGDLKSSNASPLDTGSDSSENVHHGS